MSTSLVAPAHAGTGHSLSIAESHQQAFVAGGTGTYTITVGNPGPGATGKAAVKVTGTLPAGMTALAAGGSGWSCKTSPSLSCTRSDTLGSKQAYMPITVTVGISPSLAGKTVASSFHVTKGDPSAKDQSSITVNVTVTNTQSQSQAQSQSQTVNVKCPEDDHDDRAAVRH
ncbi:hypothetical protein BEK98_09420 [Streptomyces diastatochromogenes]|uniref:DUF11 domain-containing protein n=1 Tax=Streptomyces diastatochromogenes TaxID=42236 RepID=A0A233SQ26_STRDA|nr:hypothetical protein BEK98_09420 [Streptomyces diastatochromogenes]